MKEEICKNCEHFNRTVYTHTEEPTLCGACELLLRALSISNSSMVFMDHIIVQESFGCNLFQPSEEKLDGE